MRIAKHYKSYKHIDARNARDLMNECAKTSAEMMPFYYEKYTMKPCNMDYSLDSMESIEEYIICIKLAKLAPVDLKYNLQRAGYYMGQMLKRKIGGCWLESSYPVSSPSHTSSSEYYLLPDRTYINLEELVLKFYKNAEKNSLKKMMQIILKRGGW